MHMYILYISYNAKNLFYKLFMKLKFLRALCLY